MPPVNNTPERPFQCPQCPNKFTKKYDLIQHSKTHTGVTRFQCTDCNKSFTRNSDLNRHTQAKHDPKIPCDKCNKPIQNRSDKIKRHQDTKSCKEDTLARAERANQASSSNANETSPQTENSPHPKVKPFKCEPCKLSFSKDSELKRHTQAKHGPKKACDKCGKLRQNRKDTLRTHQQSGSCRKGTGTLTQQDSLPAANVENSSQLGNSSHPPVPPFSDLDMDPASLAVSYNDNLTQHSLTDSKVKSFKCELCNKHLTGKNELKRHKQSTHSPKINCDNCGRSIQNRDDGIKRHKKSKLCKDRAYPSSTNQDSSANELSQLKNSPNALSGDLDMGSASSAVSPSDDFDMGPAYPQFNPSDNFGRVPRTPSPLPFGGVDVGPAYPQFNPSGGLDMDPASPQFNLSGDFDMDLFSSSRSASPTGNNSYFSPNTNNA